MGSIFRCFPKSIKLHNHTHCPNRTCTTIRPSVDSENATRHWTESPCLGFWIRTWRKPLIMSLTRWSSKDWEQTQYQLSFMQGGYGNRTPWKRQCNSTWRRARNSEEGSVNLQGDPGAPRFFWAALLLLLDKFEFECTARGLDLKEGDFWLPVRSRRSQDDFWQAVDKYLAAVRRAWKDRRRARCGVVDSWSGRGGSTQCRKATRFRLYCAPENPFWNNSPGPKNLIRIM